MLKNLLFSILFSLAFYNVNAQYIISYSAIPTQSYVNGQTITGLKFIVISTTTGTAVDITTVSPAVTVSVTGGTASPGFTTSVLGTTGIPNSEGTIGGITVTATGGQSVNVTITGGGATGGQISFTVLPIELSRFDAQVTGHNVIVSWATETETNNERFVVERSYNGKDFETVSTVAGAINSYTTKSYSTEDKNAVTSDNKIAYYRLKNISTDGVEDVSKVIAVNLRKGNNVNITGIYPSESALTLNANSSSEAKIAILNANGQVLSNTTIELNKGFNRANLNLEGLTRGLYFVSINVDGEMITKKFMF